MAVELYRLIGPLPVDTTPLARAAAACLAALKDERLAITLDDIHSKIASYAPRCFICYAWQEAPHKERVYRLADDLRRAGIRVVIDRDHNVSGTSVKEFTEHLPTIDKVVVVGTTVLLQKYERKEGVVGGLELPKIIERLANTQREAPPFVHPVLFDGTRESSIPSKLRGLVCLNFCPDQSYENALFDLVKGLYDTHRSDILRGALDSAVLSNTALASVGQALFERAQHSISSLKELARETQNRQQQLQQRKADRLIKEWQLPIRPNFFIAREQTRVDLLNIFNPIPEGRSTVVVIHGTPGTGKSSEVLRYAHHPRHKYTTTVWLRAESESDLQYDLLSLGYQIGILKYAEDSLNENLKKIHHWFSHHSNWLLIFDNADDPTFIEKYIPQTGGHVLITSRNPFWQLPHRLALPELNDQEGCAFLEQYLPRETDRDSLRIISRELEGLPLALAQAGAYMSKTGQSPRDYIDLLRTRARDLFRQDHLPGEENYRRIVAETFTLHLDQLPPNSLQILNLCAYLAAGSIPASVLVSYLAKVQKSYDLFYLNTDLDPLMSRGLLTRVGDTTLKINRLLQLELISRMPLLEKRELLLKLSNICIKLYREQNDIWKEKQDSRKRLIPSLETLYTHLEPILDRESIPTITSLALLIGDYHQKEKGDRTTALRYYNKACQFNETRREGSSRGALVKSLSRKASVLVDDSKGDEAIRLYERALELSKMKYKLESVEVAQEMNNFALALRKLGRTQEALEYNRQSLAIYEKVKGPDSKEVAKCLGNLGGTLRDLGKAEEALTLCLRSLEIWKNQTTPPSREMATCLGHLGSCYLAVGKTQDAVGYYRASLEMKQKVYETDHPEIASALGHLASAYQEVGQADQALKLYEQSLEIKKRFYEPDHPYIALSKVGLALALIDQEPQKALTLAHEALVVFRCDYPQEHEYVSWALHTQSLALLGCAKRDASTDLLRQAKVACEEALMIDMKLFPAQSPKILRDQTTLTEIDKTVI